MRFRGTSCDQCKAEAKHPGHGLADGPIRGWLRIVTDTDARHDFCSIKCATDWLKERKRQQAERVRRARSASGQIVPGILGGTTNPKIQSQTARKP